MPSVFPTTKLAAVGAAPAPVLYDFSKPTPFDVQASDSHDYMDLSGFDLGPSRYFRVHAGKGNDTVIGTNSRDEIWGDEGEDRLDGGGGNDLLYGGAGNDNIQGGAGMDTIYAGLDNDVVDGGADNDTLYGGAGDDILYGGQGNDTLYGDPGGDVLDGGIGNDRLDGGMGIDQLTGGLGADTFVFSVIDAWHGHKLWWEEVTMNPDLVIDYRAGEGDKLDFSGIFDTFASSIQTASEAVIKGHLYFQQSGTPGQSNFGTWVMFDTNGNQGGHTLGTDSYKIAFLKDVFVSQIQVDLLIV